MGRYQQNTHYRRRRKKKKKWPIAVLVILLLAAAFAAFWFLGGDRWVKGFMEGAQSSPAPSATAKPTETADPAPQASEEAEPTAAPEPTPTPEPSVPEIYDDGTNGYMSSGICIYNNKGFELFYGDNEVATDYARLISSFADQLPGAKVYDLVVPNHSEFGLPKRVRDYYGCTSQRENTATVYRELSSSVTPVDIYDVLNAHNDEYLYFNTDTHWAPLGAYYAYTKFCEVAGASAVPLDSFEKVSYPNFTGYLEYATGESVLEENPDTIDVYNPKFTYTCEMSDDGLAFYEVESMNLDSEDAGYSMFIHGDNACMRVKNTALGTGRKLLMVKDSYGDAFAPFLTASFDEVHIVDFRYFEANLPSYCSENGITDVLFFNNVMSANTYSQHDTMSELFD